MNSTIKLLAFALAITLVSCSKKGPVENPTETKQTAKTKNSDSLFIGVHTKTVSYPTVFDLIVGYTNSDSSFTQTDSVRGSFLINPSLDKHTSTLDKTNHLFYFIYKHASNGNLYLGCVNVSNGKYMKSVDLGIVQSDMIHLQHNVYDNNLYFSMGAAVYKVNVTTGGLSDMKQEQNALVFPSNLSSTDSYLAQQIGSKKFIYVKNNTTLLCYDRAMQKWDSISLPSSGSYRSLVVSPIDENILYSYNLVDQKEYNLLKINLTDKTTSNTVTQEPNCNILWFQAQCHPASKLYSCLPFDHQLFPYFITIHLESGKTVKYPSPSVLGQCLLD